MDKNAWKKEADCLGMDVNSFFDDYEENLDVREEVDSICAACPIARHCFAVGVSQKGWGVWGGVYLENGKISREFSKHRTKTQWAAKWQQLTMDKG
jgi:hypothetical protein